MRASRMAEKSNHAIARGRSDLAFHLLVLCALALEGTP
jgi:hypothetical protein